MDNQFRGIERAFYGYTEDCRYLESLEDRKACLPAFRSSSEFTERVDTGTGYSDPVSIWFEKLEFLEEEIAKIKIRIIPICKLLEYLSQCEPEMFQLFNLRYVRRLPWLEIEGEMSMTERTCRRLRARLVLKGAKFFNVG
jgi:hypothetical protein